MPAQMMEIKKAQKELYGILEALEQEVQSLQDSVAELQASGQSAEAEEQQLKKTIDLLKENRQRIEDLWQYSVPYGQA